MTSTVPLSSVAEVRSGYAFKSADWTDSGVPVVKIQNVRAGRVDLSGCSFVAPEVADLAAGYRLGRGDVLVTMSGEIGAVGIVDSDEPMLLNQRVGRITVTSEVADSRFIAFALQHPIQKARMENLAYGAAQPNISPSLVGSLPVWLPDLEEQKKITRLLARFDDLIGDTLRRIKILEKIVQLIYRNWFVYYRVPGYETVDLVDSDLGLIPSGWDVGFLGETLPAQLAKPKVESYEGHRQYLPTAAVEGVHEISEGEFLTLEELPSRAQFVPTRSSVWVARMAGYRKVLLFPPGWEPSPVVLSSGFLCIQVSESWWAYFAARVMAEDFEDLKARYATGATQVSLTDKGARSIPWVVPPEEVAGAFSERVAPMLKLLRLLRRQCTVLAEARDLLLPPLVSGELDVSELDLNLEWVA